MIDCFTGRDRSYEDTIFKLIGSSSKYYFLESIELNFKGNIKRLILDKKMYNLTLADDFIHTPEDVDIDEVYSLLIFKNKALSYQTRRTLINICAENNTHYQTIDWSDKMSGTYMRIYKKSEYDFYTEDDFPEYFI